MINNNSIFKNAIYDAGVFSKSEKMRSTSLKASDDDEEDTLDNNNIDEQKFS